MEVIEDAVDEFAKEHPVPDVPGKFPFYLSQALLVKMLEFSFVSLRINPLPISR